MTVCLVCLVHVYLNGVLVFALLRRIAVLRTYMWPILTDRVAWSVSLSVGLSVSPLVGRAKTAEAIELPFRLRTHGKGQF